MSQGIFGPQAPGRKTEADKAAGEGRRHPSAADYRAFFRALSQTQRVRGANLALGQALAALRADPKSVAKQQTAEAAYSRLGLAQQSVLATPTYIEHNGGTERGRIAGRDLLQALSARPGQVVQADGSVAAPGDLMRASVAQAQGRAVNVAASSLWQKYGG